MKYTINEKDYLDLCNDFSEILNIQKLPKEIIAIPWMHIIREHPEVLKRYQILFSNFFLFLLFKKKVQNIFLEIFYNLKRAFSEKNHNSFNKLIDNFKN